MAEAQVLALVQQHNKPFNAGEISWKAVGRAARGVQCAGTRRAALHAPLSVLRRAVSPRTRPLLCSAVGIGDYLAAKGIKKAAVTKALDALAAAGKLTAKVCARRAAHAFMGDRDGRAFCPHAAVGNTKEP
jgi:hypothetical protein